MAFFELSSEDADVSQDFGSGGIVEFGDEFEAAVEELGFECGAGDMDDEHTVLDFHGARETGNGITHDLGPQLNNPRL